METEYIRGKFQERNGALTARAPARFDKRGNDVWAERSGRVYQPAGMEGEAMGQPAATTGGGMGNLSRLVGGRRRRYRGGDRAWQMGTDEWRDRVDAMRVKQEELMAQGRSPYEGSLSLNEMRQRQHQLSQAEYDKSHPIMGFFGKLGRAVPGFAANVAKVAGATGAVSKPFAWGLEGLANYLKTDDGVRRWGEPGGSGAPLKLMVGGSQFSINPLEAQQLTRMDFRGGKHPYLTKTGRVRKHMKGSGIWDKIKEYAQKAGHELADPDSLLRGKYIAEAAKGAEGLAPVLNAVKPGLGDEVKNAAKGLSTFNRAASAAQHLVPGHKYTDQKRGLDEALAVAPDVAEEVSQFNKARNAFPRPNLSPRRTMARDGLGRQLAPYVREPEARLQLRGMPTRAQPSYLRLEDDEAPLLLEDARQGRVPTARERSALASQAARMGESRAEQRRLRKISGLEAVVSANERRKRMKRQAANPYPDLARFDGMTGLGKGGKKPNARAAIVKKVMAERGLSMIEASKAVKAEGLY